MYKIQRTQIRKNKNILWSFEKYPTSNEFSIHFKKKYIDTGKIIYQEKTVIGDLSNTSTQVWKSKEDFLDFLTDDFLYTERNIKSNYEVDNDIINNFVVTTELGTKI